MLIFNYIKKIYSWNKAKSYIFALKLDRFRCFLINQLQEHDVQMRTWCSDENMMFRWADENMNKIQMNILIIWDGRERRYLKIVHDNCPNVIHYQLSKSSDWFQRLTHWIDTPGPTRRIYTHPFLILLALCWSMFTTVVWLYQDFTMISIEQRMGICNLDSIFDHSL